jgi:hypothetical protein
MPLHLAVIGERSSHPVQGAGGRPLDLADTALPSSVHGAAARRFFRALADALREMRVRQAQMPTTSPLRLGLVSTAPNGTAMDVQTAPTHLRGLDLEAPSDRTTVLDALRTLERQWREGG